MTPTAIPTRFSPLARLLHWVMALAILAMLFIGVGMVSTVSNLRTLLLDIHRPLGMLILVLAAIRLLVRLTHRPPPLPADLPGWQKAAAHLSHLLLYVLMIAQPLLGWGLLSAGGYPVVLFGAFHLFPLVPQDAALFALLRAAHGWVALLLFVTVLAHLGAALFHALVRRDGVFSSMASWRPGNGGSA